MEKVMICQHCCTVNPDNATFCMKCGKRVDGKMPCLSCGTPNPPEATYCINCGKRLDQKRICPNCGHANEANAYFCAKCGKKLFVEEKRNDFVQDWFPLIGGIGFFVAAVIALIFTFCIGIKAQTSLLGEETGEISGSTSTIYIYYYFGRIYRYLKEVTASIRGMSTKFIAFSYYFPAVLGTVISAGALIVIPILFILSAIRFSNFVKGTGNGNFFAPAAASYGVYIFTVCIFLFLNYSKEFYFGEYKSSIVPGDATLAGIILGAIFLIAGVIFSLLSDTDWTKNKKERVGKPICIAIAILTIFLFVFGSMGNITIKSENESVTYTLASLMLMFSWLHREEEFGSRLIIASADTVFAYLFLIALLVLTAVLLAFCAANAADERKPILPIAISIFLLAIGNLVMNIWFGKSYFKYLDNVRGKLSYTGPIVVTVFSAILFALAVARHAINAKKEIRNTRFY